MPFLFSVSTKDSMAKPKDLVELSYLSEAVSDMSFLGLMRLLESARNFNQKHGVTGILFYDNQEFGQIIEGERADVMNTWRRIQDDKRHHRIQLLEIRDISDTGTEASRITARLIHTIGQNPRPHPAMMVYSSRLKRHEHKSCEVSG